MIDYISLNVEDENEEIIGKNSPKVSNFPEDLEMNQYPMNKCFSARVSVTGKEIKMPNFNTPNKHVKISNTPLNR